MSVMVKSASTFERIQELRAAGDTHGWGRLLMEGGLTEEERQALRLTGDEARAYRELKAQLKPQLKAERAQRKVQEAYDHLSELREAGDTYWIAVRLHSLLPTIRTKEYEVTECDFYYGWKHAETPYSDDFLAAVVEKALAGPEPDWFEDWAFPERGKVLLRVCMVMQERLAGADGTFYLSARTAGKLVGVSHTLAYSLLCQLAEERRIELVKKGRG